VDDGPLAIFADPDGDRLHDTAALCCAVTGFDVQVEAVEAIRAMVTVAASRILGNDNPAAEFAGKRILAGMIFEIVLLKGLTFIFSIQVKYSSKK